MSAAHGLGTPLGGPDGVGPELARLRKERRITGTELARLAGLSQATISRLERDVGLPDPDNVRRVANALGADGEVVDRLVEIAERAHDLMTDLRPRPGPLAERQDVIAEEESRAQQIRVFESDLVIGLMQTSDYARAILTGLQRLHGSPSPARSIEQAVWKRMSRQVVLTDPEKSFHFVLGEAALTNRLCPPEFMPAQIKRINEIAQLDNVTISIIPADSYWPIAPLHGFVLLDDNVVLIDLFNTTISSHGRSDNGAFHQVFELCAEIATTEIAPILDRHLEHYLRLLRPPLRPLMSGAPSRPERTSDHQYLTADRAVPHTSASP